MALTSGACSSKGSMVGMNNAASTSQSTTAHGASFNDADVSFAQGMIPHHQQAVAMSDLALRQSQNQDVRRLATQIRDAQLPEIQLMQGWLKTWGSPQQGTTTSMAAMPGMDHGSSTSMTMSDGMMSNADMNTMATMTGVAFDRMFLSGMIKHHQGAITMAQTERANGLSAEAKQLANQIISNQQVEIDHMTQLLQKF